MILSVTEENKLDWLAARMNGVGASESAAAVGANPYMSPVELWQRKTKRAADSEGSEPMLWGQILEPVILAEYERRSGAVVVARQQFVTHPVHPFMTATLDGMTATGKLVEVKTVSAFSRSFGEEDEDEIPDHYRIQVHHQMACTGAAEADLVVLIGGQRLKVYPVVRHDPLVNFIEDKVGEFWRCVESDTPPTWGRMTPAVLAVLNPLCSGETELSVLERQAVIAYEELGLKVAELESLRDEYKAVVLEGMGNAQTAILPDGRVVRRYLKHSPARTATVNYKASTSHYFRVLKGRS